MKNLILVIFSFFGYVGAANAQKEPVTLKFKVYGNCEMCKATIEKALDVKGVKAANWNTETKMIEVVYVPAKISEEKIHELIAASGYDTEKAKASDKVYGDLHSCCKYPRGK
jgi:periplasmic mercuric ion binding protein